MLGLGLDIVDVCTPNRVHAPVVLAALAAGKHVLCEKPVAVTPREIEKMIAASKKARRKLMVGQNNRYRGISLALKRWVGAGNLGQHISCYTLRIEFGIDRYEYLNSRRERPRFRCSIYFIQQMVEICIQVFED